MNINLSHSVWAADGLLPVPPGIFHTLLLACIYLQCACAAVCLCCSVLVLQCACVAVSLCCSVLVLRCAFVAVCWCCFVLVLLCACVAVGCCYMPVLLVLRLSNGSSIYHTTVYFFPMHLNSLLYSTSQEEARRIVGSCHVVSRYDILRLFPPVYNQCCFSLCTVQRELCSASAHKLFLNAYWLISAVNSDP